MSVCFNCVSKSKCVCTCILVFLCFCVGESGYLVEQQQMLKMRRYHVLARDTWPELAKLLMDQPQPNSSQ